MRNNYHEYEHVKYFESMPMKTFIVGIEELGFHWHTDIEIILVLEGVIEVIVEDNRHELKKGDVLLINSSTAHAFGSYNQQNMLMIMQFDSKLCKSNQKDIAYYFSCSSVFTDIDKRTAIDQLIRSMVNMAREIVLKRDGYEHYIASYFYNILGLLMRQFRMEKSCRNQVEEYNKERINNILSFIDLNFNKDLTLEMVSDFGHMSISRFSHLFKDTIGMPFKKYITLMRIEKAKELLRNTDLTILNIAYECGLNSESLLYRNFKTHLGITPSDYRKNNNKNPDRNVLSGYFEFQNADILSTLCGFLKD